MVTTKRDLDESRDEEEDATEVSTRIRIYVVATHAPKIETAKTAVFKRQADPNDTAYVIWLP